MSTGDLYASTDFGVMTLQGGNGAGAWAPAGEGLPTVEVAGLTIVPGARELYAATHGRQRLGADAPVTLGTERSSEGAASGRPFPSPRQ